MEKLSFKMFQNQKDSRSKRSPSGNFQNVNVLGNNHIFFSFLNTEQRIFVSRVSRGVLRDCVTALSLLPYPTLSLAS